METPTIKEQGRAIEYDWTVAESGPVKTVARLRVSSYHPERKCYFASIGQVTVEESRGFTTTSYHLFANTQIAREGADRYSAKALRAFGETALRELERRFEAGDEDVLGYFAAGDTSE